MADSPEQKRKTGAVPRSGGRSTASSASKRSGVSVKKKRSGNKEIIAVLLAMAGLLLFISIIGKAGAFGRVLVWLFYGLVGNIATILIMIMLFVIAWCILRGTEKQVFSFRRNILFALLVLTISALVHTIWVDFSEYGEGSFVEAVKFLWESSPGGLIGGGLSSLLQKLMAKAGALVVLIPVVIILAMVLFHLSLVAFLDRMRDHGSAAWARFSKIRERFQDEREKDREKKIKQQPKVVGEQKLSALLPGEEDDPDLSFPEYEENHKGLSLFYDDMRPQNTPEQTTLFDRREETLPSREFQPVELEEEEDDSHSEPALPKTQQRDDFCDIRPPFSLLTANPSTQDAVSEERAASAVHTAKQLEDVMQSFGIAAKVIHISRGPSVTRFELQPHSGVKVSRIKNLSDDIALNLAAPGIRIEAPIPGKAAIGIEIPNKDVQMVYLREIIESKAFLNQRSALAICLGYDISGEPIVADIAKMPHLMIAGSTGSGKSVCVNCLIMSILYKSSPKDVRLILVDPKVVELGIYNGIPHLHIPVVTEPKKAAAALSWAVQEMENRYRLFAEHNLRDIASYNEYAKEQGLEKMPRIVIIIDELADLMMVARDAVETSINRIAQKARAAGMHLVVATQRPSVDVITGLIKSNIPSRIAFKVASQVDSRTILDAAGAEKLLGRGDMLFYPVGSMKATRVQGAFVSDKEVESVVEFLKKTGEPEYDESMIEEVNSSVLLETNNKKTGGKNEGDELLPEAIEIAMELKQISASFLQRRLGIGYNRAARLIDQMEERGIIGGKDGSNPRQVLVDRMNYEE